MCFTCINNNLDLLRNHWLGIVGQRIDLGNPQLHTISSMRCCWMSNDVIEVIGLVPQMLVSRLL